MVYGGAMRFDRAMGGIAIWRGWMCGEAMGNGMDRQCGMDWYIGMGNRYQGWRDSVIKGE